MKKTQKYHPLFGGHCIVIHISFWFCKKKMSSPISYFNMTQDLCWNKLFWTARLHDVTICHKDVHKFWFLHILIFTTRLLLVWALFKFWWCFIVLGRTEILCSRWRFSMDFSWYCFLQFWHISAILWSLKRWLMFCKTRPCLLKGDVAFQWRLEAQVCLNFVCNDNFRYLIMIIIFNPQSSHPIQASHW